MRQSMLGKSSTRSSMVSKSSMVYTEEGSFNDNHGLLTNIYFTKEDKKDLEREEKEIYQWFAKRVKIWSFFVIFLSGYSLLNVFIGFNSAPFY